MALPASVLGSVDARRLFGTQSSSKFFLFRILLCLGIADGIALRYMMIATLTRCESRTS